MIIQNIYKCRHYTPTDFNLNKTCKGEKRCLILYDEFCYEYKENKQTKEKNNANNRTNN